MKQLEERPTYDLYGEASARISISFLTRFTPFTCRVSSAARALRSARGTVPTKVTVPPSVETRIPDSPPDWSPASCVSTFAEITLSRGWSDIAVSTGKRHPPDRCDANRRPSRKNHRRMHSRNSITKRRPASIFA